MADAFYLPIREDVFRSTEHTVGPWAPTDQHGGPPSALLVRALEGVLPADGSLARVGVDLLGAVPIADLVVRARVIRPGRAVQLAEAELAVDGGRVVARAQGWWHRHGETAAVATAPAAAPELPAAAEDSAAWPGGYLRAMEWRWVSGHFAEPGPATLWARMRLPLLPHVEPSPVQRVLIAADSGNGASGMLPLDRWLFVNTELTVHLARPPAGEWICLDARTVIGPSGAGLASTQLFDAAGEIGRGAQALIVRPR